MRGDPVAQHNIGLSYEYGHLVSPCLEKAIFWYRKSAANGNAQAESSLKMLLCREKLFPDKSRVGLFSINTCGLLHLL